MGRNWAGNIEFSSDRVVAPATVEELQDLVHRERKVKAQGTRHSFSSVADSDGVIVSMERFQSMEMLPGGRVRVGAGVTYGQLALFLHEKGWALHNLASLPHISVIGACATATHGSGVANGNLATSVESVTFVDGLGRIQTYVRSEVDEALDGAVVALGALGVVTGSVLQCEPTYEVAQNVYIDLPLNECLENFEEVGASAYSVSLFTTWARPVIDQVWVKRRLDREHADLLAELGAEPARRKLHPLAEMDPVNCTEQMGVRGPWHERLPHFKMEFTPSAGEELQSEFFLPPIQACRAIEALQGFANEITPALFVSEIRFVAEDGLWMSPAFAKGVVGIHFTWRKDWERVRRVLTKIEQTIERLGGVPHWGKLTTMAPQEYIGEYPMRRAFKQMVDGHDPEHKFRNAYLDSLFNAID
ncbi:MAG: FAD-binding protein [Armatimonadetes bacterium]|nr:FAD-binding protein [Armatimonadota bacterium]